MRLRSARGFALTLLLFAVGMLPALAPGQRGARRGEKYALLVGVRRYDPNELRILPYAEADVVALAEVLKAEGYKPGNVVLMTQTAGAEDTRFLPLAVRVRSELKLILNDLEAEDSVLVAFAGHGVQFRGDAESYFCPADARLADKQTLIALGALYKDLEACSAGLKLLLVDACRNDPQSANSRDRAAVDLKTVTGPQPSPPPGGVVAFFSCSEGEKAFEHADLKHGVFFHFVIEALKGEAAGPGEAAVVLPDLEKFVKRRVRDFVREKYGVRQMPELKGTSRDLVPLVSLSRAPLPTVVPLRPAVIPPRPAEGVGPAKVITNTVGMKLALIPSGEFLMGSPDSDKDADADEKPQHRVRISRPFYLGATEVTQGQYRAVTGQSPSFFKGSDDLPVENVSWDEAIAFCKKLTELEKGSLGGASYRLPTEAEWEYACRGGSGSKYSFGDDAASLGEFAWYASNSGLKTQPVGQKRANAFGVYDMHGNVWEWCLDGYDTGYYGQLPGVDPLGPSGAAFRVIRGGSWVNSPQVVRSAYRNGCTPDDRNEDMGFRVARVQAGL